jgi:hypothetical protein
MHFEKRIAVSTDVAVGLPIHHPIKAVELYESAGLRDFGVEVVPLLSGTLMLALASVNGNKLPEGINMEGEHGKMGSLPHMSEHGKGSFDYLKIKTLDMLLPHVHPWFGVNLEKIANKLGHSVYHNIHHELVNYSEKSYQHYLKRFRPLRNVLLAIENGPTKDGVKKTFDSVARFRDDGLNAVATIDVLHAAIEFSNYDDSLTGVSRVWDRVLDSIKPGTRQIHFPIGLEDNLPIEEMIQEKAMIVGLIQKLNDVGVELVVFENQHGYFTGIWEAERIRLNRIIPQLVELGLISESHYLR